MQSADSFPSMWAGLLPFWSRPSQSFLLWHSMSYCETTEGMSGQGWPSHAKPFATAVNIAKAICVLSCHLMIWKITKQQRVHAGRGLACVDTLCDVHGLQVSYLNYRTIRLLYLSRVLLTARLFAHAKDRNSRIHGFDPGCLDACGPKSFR